MFQLFFATILCSITHLTTSKYIVIDNDEPVEKSTYETNPIFDTVYLDNKVSKILNANLNGYLKKNHEINNQNAKYDEEKVNIQNRDILNSIIIALNNRLADKKYSRKMNKGKNDNMNKRSGKRFKIVSDNNEHSDEIHQYKEPEEHMTFSDESNDKLEQNSEEWQSKEKKSNSKKSKKDAKNKKKIRDSDEDHSENEEQVNSDEETEISTKRRKSKKHSKKHRGQNHRYKRRPVDSNYENEDFGDSYSDYKYFLEF